MIYMGIAVYVGATPSDALSLLLPLFGGVTPNNAQER